MGGGAAPLVSSRARPEWVKGSVPDGDPAPSFAMYGREQRGKGRDSSTHQRVIDPRGLMDAFERNVCFGVPLPHAP